MRQDPDYGYGVDRDGIQKIPPYVPVERIEALVRCNRCGAVVEGDVAGTTQHDIWHDSLTREIRHARTALPQVYGNRAMNGVCSEPENFVAQV